MQNLLTDNGLKRNGTEKFFDNAVGKSTDGEPGALHRNKTGNKSTVDQQLSQIRQTINPSSLRNDIPN